MRKNIYILFQIIFIILGLLISNIISYKNISMYMIVLFIILLYKNNKMIKNNYITNIFSFLFALFFTFGNISAIEIFESYNIPIIIYYIVSLIGYFYLIRNILLLLYEKTKNIDLTTNKKNNISKKKFIIIFSIIGFILYIPYLLEFFPGITSFDTYVQLSQILKISNYSNHHPIMHTLIIKLFFNIGYIIFKSKNIGILFFTLFQMLFVSYTFSNVLYILYKKGIKNIYLIILFIFYYLVPYNALYSITLYKDVLFSCIVLLFVLFLYETKDIRLNKLKKIQLIILTAFACLLRTNALASIILLLMLLVIKYKNKYKDYIQCISLGLLITLIFNFIIFNVFNVEKVKSVEAFSIPIQNISYVVKNNGNITKKELNELNKYISTNKIKKLYDVDYVDPVKNSMDNNYLNNNKLKFIKLWKNIGIKNINMYIKSYVYQTSGYWYHNYGVNTFPIYDNYDNLEIVHKNYNFSFVSKILNILMYLNRAVQHCLWSNAISIYIIIYSLYYLFRKNKYRIYIYPVLFIWITLLLATPVGYEFRYQYSIFISFPFILCTLFLKKE